VKYGRSAPRAWLGAVPLAFCTLVTAAPPATASSAHPDRYPVSAQVLTGRQGQAGAQRAADHRTSAGHPHVVGRHGTYGALVPTTLCVLVDAVGQSLSVLPLLGTVRCGCPCSPSPPASKPPVTPTPTPSAAPAQPPPPSAPESSAAPPAPAPPLEGPAHSPVAAAPVPGVVDAPGAVPYSPPLVPDPAAPAAPADLAEASVPSDGAAPAGPEPVPAAHAAPGIAPAPSASEVAASARESAAPSARAAPVPVAAEPSRRPPAPGGDVRAWDLVTWLGVALMLAAVPAALTALGRRGAEARGRSARPS